MKQRAEISFETEETIILRQSSSAISQYCPHCLSVVEMVTPRAAAIWADVGERTIFRLIEASEIHFIEKDGIYVCLNSWAAIKTRNWKND